MVGRRTPNPISARILPKAKGSIARLVTAAAAALLAGVLAPTGASAAGTVDQSQTTFSQCDAPVWSFQTEAQTITAGISGVLNQVDVAVARANTTTAPLIVEIRPTVGGMPSPTILASALVPAQNVPANDAIAFVSVPLNPGVAITAGQTYAIVLRSAEAASPYIWGCGISNPYPRGNPFVSLDQGVTWIPFSDLDFAFRTYVSNGPQPITCPTSIAQPFNGTPISAGNWLWFSSVLKVSGLPSNAPATVDFTNQMITFNANGTSYQITIPDAQVTFSPTATTATTVFASATNVSQTTVPSTGLAGDVFFAGAPFLVPVSLPGGINPVTWSGTISSLTPGLNVQWKWPAAVYTTFSSDPNLIGVKPVDDNQASTYQNSDHAGTPENFKQFVTGGATGGGGSNFTGSLSATASCSV